MEDDLAKISDFGLLQLMVCAYKCAIGTKEAELTEIESQLDETARAHFSPVPH